MVDTEEMAEMQIAIQMVAVLAEVEEGDMEKEQMEEMVIVVVEEGEDISPEEVMVILYGVEVEEEVVMEMAETEMQLVQVVVEEGKVKTVEMVFVSCNIMLKGAYEDESYL